MIASPEYVKRILEREGLSPNRNLGQNFFVNGDRLTHLLEGIPLKGIQVLEIGPGLGALTEILLSKGARIIAIEKDPNMVRLLSEAFISSSLTILEGDCLKLCPKLDLTHFTAAGNLPYFITADIIKMLFKMRPEQMILMLQKEAAERFFAAPSDKNYTPLGAAVNLYYSIKKLDDISPDNYIPSPNVYSSMVHLKKRENAPEYDPDSLLSFFEKCFRMRRKTLVNNLSMYPNVKEVLFDLNLSSCIRGEALSPDLLLSLYTMLEQL